MKPPGRFLVFNNAVIYYMDISQSIRLIFYCPNMLFVDVYTDHDFDPTSIDPDLFMNVVGVF